MAWKWYSPSIAAQAESFGFVRHGRTIFIPSSVCWMSLHHSPMGNSFGSDAITDLNPDLKVWTARSAGGQCPPGGEYCTSAFWDAMKSSTSVEVSLSIL